MAFYVYILRSLCDDSFYKGYSQDPIKRLAQHNNGFNQSTKHCVPWKLVYVEAFDSKQEALKREKNLKKASRQRILALIDLPKNIVQQFLS
jgi:putative endonuclease